MFIILVIYDAFNDPKNNLSKHAGVGKGLISLTKICDGKVFYIINTPQQ